ncbi:hypothetical protein M413DRAFT_255281 [Hebeloma cylindrosporum]|uniref:Uncharacterized protein n=1 Tax=Hebeloma cylindrosporum TaxID=76867 RepID=A0A0C3BM33_HEBCY|nr:hypothetical protein M413DRAFT_255281 [Hebeloma cylindrosporum h7]
MPHGIFFSENGLLYVTSAAQMTATQKIGIYPAKLAIPESGYVPKLWRRRFADQHDTKVERL